MEIEPRALSLLSKCYTKLPTYLPDYLNFFLATLFDKL
jgi:hypothetical protein